VGSGGDEKLQRQAARTGLAILMMSAGVPMITGGDEMYRSQFGNNNAYNVDTDKNYLDYSNAQTFVL
jgi:isoamylase